MRRHHPTSKKKAAGDSGDDTPKLTWSEAHTVVATYPNHGAGLLDFVAGADAACDANDLDVDPCLHAGVLRKLEIAELSSCSGLSAADNLEVFDWSCSLVDGHVVFQSSGFKSGKTLRDLVTADGENLRQLQLSVTGPDGLVGTTELASWWSTPVSVLAENTTASTTILNEPGIYTIPSSRLSSGVEVRSPKVALLVMEGEELSYSPAASFGSLVRVDGNSYPGTHYVRIEGAFSGNDQAAYGIVFLSSAYGRVQNVQVSDIRGSAGSSGAQGADGSPGETGIQGSNTYTCIDTDEDGLTELIFTGQTSTTPTDGSGGSPGGDGGNGGDAGAFFVTTSHRMQVRNLSVNGVVGGQGGNGGAGGSGGNGGNGFGSPGGNFTDYFCDTGSATGVYEPYSPGGMGGNGGNGGQAGSGGTATAVDFASSNEVILENIDISNVTIADPGNAGSGGTAGGGGSGSPSPGNDGNSGILGSSYGLSTWSVSLSRLLGTLEIAGAGATTFPCSSNSDLLQDMTCTITGTNGSSDYPDGSQSTAVLNLP